MYYRYQNTDVRTLPERIRLVDGSTRTALHELSDEALTALGVEIMAGDYPEPPTASIPLTHKQFMDRLTDSELAGIMIAAKSSVEVELWFKRFELAQDIILSDSQTIAGVNALETAGLIAAGRAAEILNG